MTPRRRRTRLDRATAPAMLAMLALLASSAIGHHDALAVSILAVPDTYSVRHDRTLSVAAPGVLSNDVGLLGTQTAVRDSGPSHGSLTLRADGSFTYTPNPGFVGEDEFAYHVRDGLLPILSSMRTTATIDVTNVGPVAKNDSYTAETGVELSVPAPGVLANDTDADGDRLTVAFTDTGGNGSFDPKANGSFTFKSGGSFVGDRTFTYRVWDGIAWSKDATVTIRVGSLPAPTPTAEPTPAITLPPLATLPPLPTLPPVPTLPPLLPTLPPDGTPTSRPTPTGPTASPDTRPSPSIDTPTPRPSAAPGSTTTPGSPSPTEPRSGGGGFGVGGGTERDSGGGTGTGGLDGVTAAALGSLPGGLLAWSYPAIVMTLPGILLLIAIGAQAVGALAWLPIVRRRLGGFGAQGKRASPGS